ncbi:MAG: xanthan lyase [Verrucomicrobia bacterium]|nr:MAG: xanthan lyase [Verrucomicrobiota bacterium]
MGGLRSGFCALVLCPALVLSSRAASIITSDVCVYGGTSGGVIAAVAAARLGKSVSLICVNNHAGGMSSGGLGITDVGNAASIGGIANEFYTRVGQVYNSIHPVYYFEPHVAENVFWQMLGQADVAVYTNQELASVTMSGQVISQITMADGTAYTAKEFIDTTYEGDLMAMAGVNFTWGRESSSTYGETSAGILYPAAAFNYDPYVIAGNPASGLLPLLQTNSVGTPGQADSRLQAFNYRLCLTQVPTNQLPITPPTNYSEATYELVRRYLVARGSVQLTDLINIQNGIAHAKTDINAKGELSTDYVGGNYGYATNSFAGRELIRQAHEDYIRGLLYFYATSTNVPLNVRTQMQSWGLCKDEFQDRGGWPHQLYVREARRMVSDYVMLQQDCLSSRVASDPICLASYSLDLHPAERFAFSGVARVEGGLSAAVPYPYPISYRSIIPASNQCQNLFCTYALSASHVAFGSIRMEPVFMMLSQSAGTAAAFAIDDQVPAQQLSYAKLAAELRADKQLLAWNCASQYYTNTITLDQGNPCFVTSGGVWYPSTTTGAWNGSCWSDLGVGKGSKWVIYKPTILTNGSYDIYLWWVASSNCATNTPVDIIHPAGTNRVYLDQTINGSTWVKVFTTNLNAGTASSVIIRNDGTLDGTYCVANGVQWRASGFPMPPPPAPPPAVEIVASAALTGEFGTNKARFTIVRNNDPVMLALTVNYSVSGTASNGLDYTFLPDSVTIPAGALATNIIISPLGTYLAADQATVTLTLSPPPNFTLTSLSNATLVIQDRPINIWRRANFTPAELADPSVSGDLADPNQDGYSNLMSYALGISPKDPAPANLPSVNIQAGYLTFTYTRAKAATDVSLTLDESSDFVHWQSGPGVIQQVSTVDNGAVQSITFRLAAPVNFSPGTFLRLRTSRL